MKRFLFLLLASCLYLGQSAMAQEPTFQQLLQMANAGNVAAQYNLGIYYKEGKGVTQSYTEAVKWWRKAAEQGDVDAQFYLGNCYEKGEGVTQSYTEAVKWWRKAAEQGGVYAQYSLGLSYFEGEGVTLSYTEAVKWWRKAAEQGLANAQFNLGICYKEGKGVTQSYTEAAKWWRKAAEQGLANAQFALGRLYTVGQGVTQSNKEALNWWRKAAEQGYEEALEALDTYSWYLENVDAQDSQPSSSAAKSQSQAKSSSSTQTQSSAKRHNSGIMTLKDHVFGFIGTPPSQCTISSVSNEVYSKYGFRPQETSGSLLSWYEISKPVGFNFVLNGKRIGWATFFQNGNYKSWTYGISEMKTSTTFNDYANYTKQLQRELEAEGYVFKVLSSANEEYDVESRNKDVVIELRCCSGSRLKSHDAWTISISFISE